MVIKSLDQVIKENKQYGFDPAIIQIAYANVQGQADKVLQEIFRLQSQSNSYPVKPHNAQDEDAQLSKAIQMSISQAKDKKINLQPLNPQQRVRKSGVPVGLKNIGNTCYFNSLLQTYFQNAVFVRQILKYQIPQKYHKLSPNDIEKRSKQDFQFKRKLNSCRLVENLRNLFVQMIGSDRKYIDPTAVLTSIVDDEGNELPVGDQKDIGEFNLIFLSRIDEGLNELYSKQKMQIEGQHPNKTQQSPSKLKVIGGSEQNIAYPQSTTHSLLKHSSIKLTEHSLISQQFIGKISNSFHNQQFHFHKQQTQLFSLLFVNVKNKELYQALEEVVISHIDDYRNEKGQVVGVEKRTWIHEAPKTLFFQIDRVVFDKEKGQLQKINDIFDFPKEFYIDPFLDKNKQKALQIQQTVKKLRQQKLKYIEFLDQLQHYGKQKQNLLQTLQLTHHFLQSQTNKMQIQQQSKTNQSPLIFPQLQSKVTSSHLNILNQYIHAIQKKQKEYQKAITTIEQKIQKCYESIRKSQPYYLYSILIHQGSAEMGHYYSYIYDIETQIWRKYNDINISEELQEQVLKEAKGVNTTSAYYLVYAQKDILVPLSSHPPIRSYKMSTDQQGYLKDYYGSFLTPQLKEKLMTQNHNMYYEIEQYKMGSFATRVVDSYTKKFQICNQTFRKSKPAQKKKNTPPILINLPVYLRNIDENEYKSILIQHCIQEYGPKQYNPAFDEILNKKVTNFNEHKRPKKFHANEKYITQFMQDIYQAIAARQIFTAIKEQSYNRIFPLLSELLKSESGSYFNWLANLLSKTIVVHLLIEAENKIPVNEEEGFEKLKLMTFILFKFINLEEQKILVNNCIFWLTQIGILFKSQQLKQACHNISQMISQRSYKGEFDQYFMKNEESQNTLQDIRGSIEIADACWNLSRTQDVYINKMLEVRQQVKEKIEAANEMYREMKKSNLPLQREQRDRIKNKKKQQ